MATGTILKQVVKLWENSNKTASFAAKTVPLDLSLYKYVYAVAGYGSSNQYEATNIVPINNTSSVLQIIYNLSGSRAYIASRNFSASSTGVTFESAYLHGIGTTTAPSYDNGNCIPHYIYGIKDWLFGDSPINLN